MLAAALRFAGHGWAVLPCNGKAPLVAGGVHAATTDAGSIREWWQRWPEANVAVRLPAGWCAVDLDTPTAAQALEAQGWSLPATAVVATGRGAHYYFRAERPVVSRCGVAPGVDLVGGDGGRYLVAPPSRHPSGKVYRWLAPPRDAAPAPEWVYTVAAPDTERPALRAVLAEQVRPGARNETLARFAGAMVRYLPAVLAVDACRWLNERRFTPPLTEDEFERVMVSILTAEARRREVSGAERIATLKGELR